MLFLSGQQVLDCINDKGQILGQISFNHATNGHVFHSDIAFVELSSVEQSTITERLSGLNSGKYSIPMQDDD